LRFLTWPVILVVAVLLADFAIGNGDVVEIGLWPFPAYEMKLWYPILGALFFGFLAGELVAWLNGRRWRQRARRQARRIEALERELAATQAQLKSAAEASRSGAGEVPALRRAGAGR
jgi:uncharacterized integral membrane protein